MIRTTPHPSDCTICGETMPYLHSLHGHCSFCASDCPDCAVDAHKGD